MPFGRVKFAVSVTVCVVTDIFEAREILSCHGSRVKCTGGSQSVIYCRREVVIHGRCETIIYNVSEIAIYHESVIYCCCEINVNYESWSIIPVVVVPSGTYAFEGLWMRERETPKLLRGSPTLR